jgi:two-component system, NtrC family, response regulator AtoC
VNRFLLVVAVVQDPGTRSLARMACERSGHRLIECDSYRQAQALLSNGLHPDLLLFGWTTHDAAENALRIELGKRGSAKKVYLIAGLGGDLLRKQAADLRIGHVTVSPGAYGELETIVKKVSQGIAGRRASDEFTPISAEPSSQSAATPEDTPTPLYLEELGGNDFFLAASPRMLEIHRQVKLLAASDVNVLILGESGTGKEVIAQLIHRTSPRSREKFLKVNCAALPADLLESELFGHRQGAFTGAIKDHAGKFEQADGGTLLLDEIGEIEVQTQAKLLHVLQDGQFSRLGGQGSTRVDVRVVAATNVQIEDALLKGAFREDLYYRLSVFTIHVPPLRERCEEIPYFIEETIRRAPASICDGLDNRLPARLLDAALLYDWPGNLRELRNFITRTIILRDPDAAARELEAKMESRHRMPRGAGAEMNAGNSAGMRSVVRDVKDRAEMQMIVDALEASGWNRRRAAQFLNISYRALLYKIQQHRLTPRTSRSINGASIAD